MGRRLLLIAVLGLILPACSGCKASLVKLLTPDYEAIAGEPSGDREVEFSVVAEDFEQITDLQLLPTEPDVMMVLQKSGELRWFNLRSKARGQWYRFRVLEAGEQGALGLAFHPRFSENGRLFLNSTVDSGSKEVTRISEWRVQPGCKVGKCKPEQAAILLEVEQPYSNHNAGQIAFGPDGYLYIGMGDGGWRDDPHKHGQNLATLLGTMLRIDVDRVPKGKPYGIPADNPGRRLAGARAEIYAYGLRNPWRFSWDDHQRLVVADVGQDRWEEVHVVSPGANLGWPIKEGRHCYQPLKDCPEQGLIDPVFEVHREQAASITGGLVYRGQAMPWLLGKYLVADFITGRLWALDLPEALDADAPARLLGLFPYRFSAFGQGRDGEIYAGAFVQGQLLRLVPRRKKP